MSDLVSRACQAHLCGIHRLFFYVQQVLLASITKTTLTHWERPAQWALTHFLHFDFFSLNQN